MRRVILLAVLSASGIFAAGGDLRLIQAAKKADVKAVPSLLQQKAGVFAVEADGTTPPQALAIGTARARGRMRDARSRSAWKP